MVSPRAAWWTRVILVRKSVMDVVDPAAAEEAVGVLVVADDGLAGGDGEDGVVEGDGEMIGSGHEGGGGGGIGVGADFGADAERFLRAGGIPGEPIYFAGGEGAVHEVIFGADGDGVGVGIDAGDVDGVAEGDADAFALSDGEALVAFVGADGFAGGVDDVAVFEGVGGFFLDEFGVVVVGDEADFLGVGLVEDGKLEFLGDAADFGFFKVADREEHACQLVARDAEEDVGLIFLVIESAGGGGFRR